MKKLCAIMLVVVMALGILPFAASADETWSWEIKEGVLTVTGEGDVNCGTTVESWPWHAQRADVTKVVVTDGITGILGGRAFQDCKNMTEIEFGKDCSKFGSDVFSGCGSLTKVTYNATVVSMGNGNAYQSGAIAEVFLTNQTAEEFKAVASKSAYNFKDNGGIATGFDTATYTTRTVEIELDWPQTVTITPKFGVIENWSGDTYLIWELTGATNESLDAIHAKMKDDTYTVKYVITDETDDKTYTITKYNKVGGDIGDWAAWYRIGTGYYGITLVADHAYTLAVTIYEGEEVRYTGVSEEGAFVSNQKTEVKDEEGNVTGYKGFLVDGAITPEEVPYTYEEATPVVPPVDPEPPVDPIDPPQAGDATVMIAVLAVVALFGAAVVTKKVFVK